MKPIAAVGCRPVVQVFLFLLFTFLPSSLRAAPISTADYFPLQAGYSWTYLENGINTVTLTVLPGTEIVNGLSTVVVQQSGGEDSGTKVNYSLTVNGLREHRESSPNVFIPPAGFYTMTITLSPPMKLANTTVSPGDIFTSSGTATLTLSGIATSFPLNYNSTSRVVSFEDVTVPLGTFHTVKSQTSVTISGYIGPDYLLTTATREVWAAKYIGTVKEIISTDGVQESAAVLTGINFSPHLAADFTANKTNGTAPLAVTFTDLSDGNVTAWSWNFGDGSTSTQQNPSHTYTTGGTYTVRLTATGPGATSTKTKTNYITVSYPPPVANFFASPTSGTAPFNVQFTDLSSGPISTWAWTFGDGSTSSQRNPPHTYTTPGTYSVTLTVTGPGGNNQITRTNYITVAYPPPVANFTANQTTGTAPYTVQFTDQSTGSITSRTWTFGDGSTVNTQQNPSHIYSTPGHYTVDLTVTGPGGSDTKTGSNYINVAHPGVDINQDNTVDLADLILTLQVMTREGPPQSSQPADIDGDNRTGPAEAVYLMRFLSVAGP